ncbi:hypothetical protein PVAG01_07692 [Phlyctema vagabunda]|uniref:Uncharacterized protein n=1 Tax=Phlyctema vagabunda TaxID=108571 RepID=A0ABR4PD73_9HELO
MDPDKTRSWDVDTFLGNDGDRPGYQVLQYAASLIIIQKHAQVRELSPDEKVQLQRLKKGTGWFLDMLRTADIASVMAFSLCDMKPNTVDGLPEPSKASSSTDSESATLCGASVTEVSASTKEEQEPKAEAGPPSAPSFLPPAKTYEMWRISEGGRIVKANNKNIRIFGISLPFKVASSEIVDGTLSTKTPLSDEEITQILADKDTKLSGGDPPRTLDMLSQVSEAAHSIISQLVNDRSKNDRYNWTLKDVSGVPESKRPGWWARRRGERPTNRISHATWIVILEGVEKWRPRPPGWRPAAGPPGPPPPRGPTIVYVDPKPNKQKVKSGTKLKLTQQETENVINDFLASISTLYDDVPIEERATALQSVEIPSGDEYDSDDDSDGSSSTSSGSVADD